MTTTAAALVPQQGGSETKFTPGPWVAASHFAQGEGGRTYIPVLRPGNDPVPLAVVHRDVDGYGKQEGEANAHLIAAAPELFAALAAIVKAGSPSLYSTPHFDARLETARAVLARATGAAS